MSTDNNIQINLSALADEILGLKNKLIKQEMKEKEMKFKFTEMHRLLTIDRSASAALYKELKEWART